MSNPNLSRHATMRCQQRGIPHVLIKQIMDLHDLDHEVGDECRALRISQNALEASDLDRPDAQQTERLADLTVIWSDRNNQVVTAFRDKGGRKTRRYRGRN